MWIRTKALQWAMLTLVVGGLSVACGSAVSDSSEGSQGGSTGETTEESTRPSEEGSSNVADTVGNLILLSDGNELGANCTLTFIDTETGESSSRTFSLADGTAMNPGGQASVFAKTCGNPRLPLNADLTRLAVVGDQSDAGYYRSAGYIEADGEYVEVTSSESSFEGEGGFYAATFQGDQLLALNRDNEWVDPASQEVQAPGPEGVESESDLYSSDGDLYISGSELADYELGNCTVPARATSGCYESGSDYSGDIVFTGNDSNTNNANIEVEGGDCDSLLAADSEDNLFCVEKLDNGKQQLIRVDKSTRIGISTGEAHAITLETDQEILQAIVLSNDEQVLFTSRRDEDDPITAYVVAAGGGTEPRELPELASHLGTDQELYRWTASNDHADSEEPTSAEDEPESQSEQTWSGQITAGNNDDSTSEYGVEADIVPVAEMTEDLIGEIVGVVSYDSLDCSSVWILKEVNENSVVMEEEIRERPALTCVDIGPVTLTPQGDDTLEYRRVDSDDNSNVDVGILSQVDGAQETNSTEPTSDEEPDEEVEQAVRGHYEAIGEADFEEAYSYFGPTHARENSEEGWISEEESYGIQSSTIHSIDVTEANEDTATAEVDVSFEDNTGEPRFVIAWNLVREGGEWKLDEYVSGEEVE